MEYLTKLQGSINPYNYVRTLTYSKGDLVIYHKSLYRSLKDNNSSNPDTNNWLKLT